MVGKKAAKINLYEDDREEEKKTGLEIMMMTVYANYLPVYIHSSYVMTMHFIFFWRVIHHYCASNGYHKRRTMVNAVDTYTLAVVIRNHDNSVLIYIYIYMCVCALRCCIWHDPHGLISISYSSFTWPYGADNAKNEIKIQDDDHRRDRIKCLTYMIISCTWYDRQYGRMGSKQARKRD